eukprot:2043230-Prymnesium_polylepis.3
MALTGVQDNDSPPDAQAPSERLSRILKVEERLTTLLKCATQPSVGFLNNSARPAAPHSSVESSAREG